MDIREGLAFLDGRERQAYGLWIGDDMQDVGVPLTELVGYLPDLIRDTRRSISLALHPSQAEGCMEIAEALRARHSILTVMLEQLS